VIALEDVDPTAVEALRQIIREEQEHHDKSLALVPRRSWWAKAIDGVVARSTEAVICLGMRL